MAGDITGDALPLLAITRDDQELFRVGPQTPLAGALADILTHTRWFSGKARTITSTEVVENVGIPDTHGDGRLLFVQVTYAQGPVETYALPVALATAEQAGRLHNDHPESVMARFRDPSAGDTQAGVLYDALWNPDYCRTLLEAIGRQRTFKGIRGEVHASPTDAYAQVVDETSRIEPFVMRAEQSNTSVRFGNRAVLKLYRRVVEGENPESEIGRVLTSMRFPNVPPFAGAIEYRAYTGERATLATLQGFVEHQGDGWQQALHTLKGYFSAISARQPRDESGWPQGSLLALAAHPLPESVRERIGSYLNSADHLGRRTAELHLALARCDVDPAFTPEPFSAAYRQARYESMCRMTTETLNLLRARLDDLPADLQTSARDVLEHERDILARMRAFALLDTGALRTRCHGDYHLGQVLCVGEDFMIIDFEGEPARPVCERREKHSPLLDVAGMLRSFHYAPYAAIYSGVGASGTRAHEDMAARARWAEYWRGWVSTAFLQGYLAVAARAPFWPSRAQDAHVLLRAHVFEKAMYELGYELNHRPDWTGIPLQGIMQLLRDTD